MKLQLKDFDEDQAMLIRSWFDDPTTNKWLGDRSWLDNIFRLQNEPIGTEFRGAKKVGYSAFVAYDGKEAVGFIDGSIYDRWVKYGGEAAGKPIFLEIIEQPTAGISFVTNPTMRRQGYAAAILRALINHPSYGAVKIFEAGVEPENIGSIKALEAAGFKSDYEADFEGMYYFLYMR